MGLTCVAAQATEAEEPKSGFTRIAALSDDVSLKPMRLGANGQYEEFDPESDGACPGAVKMKISYSKATAGKEYLLCVLIDDGAATATPSADNMAYINQQTAETAAVEFTAYPKKPGDNDTSIKYAVWLSSNADAGEEGAGITGFTKVATFEYYGEASVLLGDVNGDTNINAMDARIVLQSAARLTTLTDQQKLAANVNKDANVNAQDARMILQYAAKLITSFG